MTEPTPTIARDAVLARLAALKTTTTPALKQEWRTLFGTEPPPPAGSSVGIPLFPSVLLSSSSTKPS